MNLSPFEEFDLSPELLKALEKKGYTRPTAIQLEAIPAAMGASHFNFNANP